MCGGFKDSDKIRTQERKFVRLRTKIKSYLKRYRALKLGAKNDWENVCKTL